VTVTKTKVAELPNDIDDQEVDSTTNNAPSNVTPTYTFESDALIVTPSCLNRVERLIHQRNNNTKKDRDDDTDDYFLRVYVDAGGCSGFQYQFEMDHDFDQDDDIVIVSAMNEVYSTNQRRSPRIVTDTTSLEFLEGATLDYVMEMIKSSFVVRENPQSESACGCGSSFARKNFTANPATD
jgi:iron-sulfur cluster assembly 2